MWEIFGALFGGAYILGKLSSEKADKRAADYRHQQYQAKMATVTDMAFESSMKSKMHWGKPYAMDRYREVEAAKEKMVREIPESELVYVFGRDWEKLFFSDHVTYLPYSSRPHNFFTSIYDIAFNIWMSHHHLLTTEHTTWYGLGGDITGLDTAVSYDVTLKACKIIEKHIQEKRPDMNLTFKNPYWIGNNQPETRRFLEWSSWHELCQTSHGTRPW